MGPSEPKNKPAPQLHSNTDVVFSPTKGAYRGHEVHHVRTTGNSFLEAVIKLFKYICSSISDWTVTDKDKEDFYAKLVHDGQIDQKHRSEADMKVVDDNFEEVSKDTPTDSLEPQRKKHLFNSLVLSSTYADNAHVVDFMNKHPPQNGSIQFFTNGLFPKQKLRDPFSVISKLDKKKIQNSVIVFPYVFEGTPAGHIVLVTINVKDKKIIYYDPQGKTADDTTRPKVGDYANMEENLKAITGIEGLPNDGWEFLHNVAPHQTDYVNCGFYVMRALQTISEIEKDKKTFFDPIQRALSYDSSEESGTKLRRRMGKAYGIALGYFKA